jgi:RimJ/RimL family protein N-acetyltransferase
MEWCKPTLNREELAVIVASLEEAWETGSAFTFVILDYTTGELLGSVGLNRIHRPDRFANLHYWVRSGKTGRGVATEASRLVCRYAFEELALERIGILVPEGNVASQHVAERLGATLEGVARNGIRLHDRQMNATQYSLIPSDLDRFVAA